MKCKQVQAALAVTSREWGEAERQQIEAHLSTCAACAAIARDYARQADRLTALPRVSLSMAQQQAILTQVLRAPQSSWSRRLVNAFGAAAGVLILGVLVAALLWAFNNPTSLSLTATVTSVLAPTLTSTPTLSSAPPTPAPPTLAPAPPPATVMLPDGTFATATPVTPDPVYATQEAAYRATLNASRATLIAHATTSPFPTAGPSIIQVDRAPFRAVTERGGLSLEVSVPKLSYVAGESGFAEVTWRNHTADTVFAESSPDLVVLDERGQIPDPWPWSPLSLPGRAMGLGTKLEPGQIFTATVSFRIPPLERSQGHHFSLWIETLYRNSLPGLPDIPGDISQRFEAGPLPVQVNVPSVAQQLNANLQLDQTGWRLQVTDHEGRPPVGPLSGEFEAAWSNGATAGPLGAEANGVWSGQWADHRLLQSGDLLIMRAWVAAPGYVTAAVKQTLPADSPAASSGISSWFSASEPPTRHTAASLEEAQATLNTAIYRPARLPEGAALEDIVHWDGVSYDGQRRLNLVQTYRLSDDEFLTLHQAAAEGYDPALWGAARYAPDVQLVTVDNTTGYLIQRFGFWLLDWTVNDHALELRVPVSAVSVEQLVNIAAGVQPLR